jgi:hypothetical protein
MVHGAIDVDIDHIFDDNPDWHLKDEFEDNSVASLFDS